jgi:hypothetical protein
MVIGDEIGSDKALTLHFELDSFGDGGRDAVARHTQIGRHVKSADFGYRQNLAIHDIH